MVFGSFPIAKLPSCIGRGSEADVRLPNITVSTRHARIDALNAGLAVGDLDSRNGTFVNGRRINSCFPIVAGDLLQFGNMLLELQCAQTKRSDMTCLAGDIPLAEGVETDEEAAVCQELGFELFQGFLFGSPIPRKTTDPFSSNILIDSPAARNAPAAALAFGLY